MADKQRAFLASPLPCVQRPRHRSNPYQPVGDFLSNVGRFKIIESTLREGEQFANAYFDTEAKIKMLVLVRGVPP